MFAKCLRGNLQTSELIEETYINLPSSPILDGNL